MMRSTLLLALAAAAALAACDDGVAPSADPVRAFVASADLPRAQTVVEVLRTSVPDLSLFRLSWGAPLDCRSSCYYGSAVGLRHGERVGWLRAEGEEGPTSLAGAYDFDASDEPLWEGSTLALLRRSEPWLFQYALLPALARDADVPEDALVAVAGELLLSVNLDAARGLLENAAARGSAPVLRRLAGLPDAYAPARAQATRLLVGGAPR